MEKSKKLLIVSLLHASMFNLYLYGDEEKSKPVIVDDMSGLSKKDIRKKAENLDKKSQKNLKIKDVIESIDENGSVEVTKLVPHTWEELSPTPKDGFDWVKTKYGDWIKGHIKSMYDDELEFDSKEFGLYVFKLKDLKQIKSFNPMSVNIDNVAIFKGIIRYKDSKITIIGGEGSYTFDKKKIISITSGKNKEIHNWSGDISLNVDIRRGNKEQSDFSLKINLKRRTPQNRLTIDYLGAYTEVKGVKTAEDNRINFAYDKFISKNFFATPTFGEVYQNYFQNLKYQVTLGAGFGYTIYNTPKIEWYISSGPAFLGTKFYQSSITSSDSEKSFAFQTSSRYSYKITSLNKITIKYNFTFTDKKSGQYKHHSVITFENDIIKDKIFIDTSLIWDYINNPKETQDGIIPQKSDLQFLLGAGIKF
jgi:putative salt-induced outer membrane protein YdiY